MVSLISNRGNGGSNFKKSDLEIRIDIRPHSAVDGRSHSQVVVASLSNIVGKTPNVELIAWAWVRDTVICREGCSVLEGHWESDCVGEGGWDDNCVGGHCYSLYGSCDYVVLVGESWQIEFEVPNMQFVVDYRCRLKCISNRINTHIMSESCLSLTICLCSETDLVVALHCVRDHRVHRVGFDTGVNVLENETVGVCASCFDCPASDCVGCCCFVD